MPRIDAPTVAEHRRMRHRSVVESAAHLLMTSGAAAVTPAAVAEAAGLARSSVYQYFPTSNELVSGAVEEVFRRYTDHVVRSVAGLEGSRQERLVAYVQASFDALDLGVWPALGLAADLTPEYRERMATLHLCLARPLADILEDSEEPTIESILALGVIQSGVVMVQRGLDAEDTIQRTMAFLGGALQHAA